MMGIKDLNPFLRKLHECIKEVPLGDFMVKVCRHIYLFL